jgi:DNA-binding IclR family transcriptional regulator
MTAEESARMDWLHLVQAEYLEMPGLQLTQPQVRRLWGLEEETCHAILDQLVAIGFLRRTARDLYVLDAPIS